MLSRPHGPDRRYPRLLKRPMLGSWIFRIIEIRGPQPERPYRYWHGGILSQGTTATPTSTLQVPSNRGIWSQIKGSWDLIEGRWRVQAKQHRNPTTMFYPYNYLSTHVGCFDHQLATLLDARRSVQGQANSKQKGTHRLSGRSVRVSLIPEPLRTYLFGLLLVL